MNQTIEKNIKLYAKINSFDEKDYYAIEQAVRYGVELFQSQPLADRLTDEEKERVRKEYANTYPNDIDCGVENMLIQGVLERIFGADFFKEEE